MNLQVKLSGALQERIVFRVGDSGAGEGRHPESWRQRTVSSRRRSLRVGSGRIFIIASTSSTFTSRPCASEATTFSPSSPRHSSRSTPKNIGSDVPGFTPQALMALKKSPWPGNIRQLENRIKKALVMCEKSLLGPEDLDLGKEAETPILPLEKAKEEFGNVNTFSRCSSEIAGTERRPRETSASTRGRSFGTSSAKRTLRRPQARAPKSRKGGMT